MEGLPLLQLGFESAVALFGDVVYLSTTGARITFPIAFQETFLFHAV
jgi:hypothetical protein